MSDQSERDSPNPSNLSALFGVPLLALDDAADDPEALATWHEAISDALILELPHDLLALWLYPHGGDVVLLGPAALAEDNLAVPIPTPFVPQDELLRLEEIVRGAGYGSVMATGIRHGDTDVGLMLLANLRPGLYGPNQGMMLQHVARVLGPAMARIGRHRESHPAPTPLREATLPPPSQPDNKSYRQLGGLLAALGGVNRADSTPRAFVAELSVALQPMIPHDQIELLVPDSSEERCYRLGEHGPGPLWSDPALIVPYNREAIAPLAMGSGWFLVRDSLEVGQGHPWGATLFRVDDTACRSVLGTYLGSPERIHGYLVLGSAGPDLYRETDGRLLSLVGGLITPKIDGFLLAWRQEVLRTHLSVLRSVPAHLGKISEILATVARLDEAMKLFAREAGAVIPFERLEFAVRLGEEDRVAMVLPGTAMPLADLPQVPFLGTPTGRVIKGEAPYIVTGDPNVQAPSSIMVVPLRVASRIFGAMIMAAPGPAAFNRADATLAQQLADVIAPHFELLRRAAMSPPPAPVWRRTRRF